MITIKAYLVDELSNPARIDAEAGAMYYAAGSLLQGKNCPPHLVPKVFEDFKQEYLKGYFSIDGQTRFPENCAPVAKKTEATD